MKKLILVRHAKSSWEHNVIDHERPLKERGVNDAGLVSGILTEKCLPVDLVLSSDATRAKTTCNIFVDALGIDKNSVHLNHDLYDFSGERLVETIKACEDHIDNLMVFGHNHAITVFVNTFGDRYIDNVPTCGTVILEFDIDNWKQLKPGSTLFTIFPKDYK